MRCRDSSREAALTGLLGLLALAGCAATPPEPQPAERALVVPEEAAARHAEAVLLIEQRRDDEAAVLLELLVESHPHLSGPWVNLGLIHQRAGRDEAAERAYREAAVRNPANAVAHGQLGLIYREQGRFEEAAAAYEQALASDPDYALVHLNYGVLLDLYLRRPQQALAHYERYESLAVPVAAGERPDVAKWIVELRRRIESGEITARAEP